MCNQTLILSYKNHFLIQEIFNNNALGSYEELKKDNENFSDEIFKSIIVDGFLADLIADFYNKKLDKNNPITYFSSKFPANYSCEYISEWFDIQSILWVTNKSERSERPYWRKLLVSIYEEKLSSCIYEIDRYDSLLYQWIECYERVTTGNLYYTACKNLKSYDELLNSFDKVEITEKVKEKLNSLNLDKNILYWLLCESASLDISLNFEIIQELYSLMLFIIDVQKEK